MKKELRAEDFPVSEGHQIIGKLQKAHGIRGEVFLYVFPKEAAWLDSLKKVSLQQALPDGQFRKHTFTVLHKRWHKDGIIARLEGLDTRNQVEELKGAMFEVPQSFFVSEEGEGLYLQELLNFDLVNEEGYRLGVIKNFSSNGIQDLAEVQTEKGTFDVPLIDEWMIEIDRETNQLTMRLPQGLLGEDDLGDDDMAEDDLEEGDPAEIDRSNTDESN